MWLQDGGSKRKKRVTSQEEDRREERSRGEGTGQQGEREKDITMQSAPSALRLRCGLAPSSQSQPDPHIALIYLEEEGRQQQRGGGGLAG